MTNKKARTVADLVAGEIFPRYGSPLQSIADNGPENYILIINVEHITTSPYHPQINANVERFHKT